MNLPFATLERLQFLDHVVTREASYLHQTDERLFIASFTPALVARLGDHPDIAERVEAFVGRFGRLQDTLGDKLLPTLLATAQRLHDEIAHRGWL